MNTHAGVGTKLLAVSGTVALIVYILAGMIFGAWAWAWVVFLVPGAIRAWMGAGESTQQIETQGRGAGRPAVADAAEEASESHRGSEGPSPIPPPRTYEG